MGFKQVFVIIFLIHQTAFAAQTYAKPQASIKSPSNIICTPSAYKISLAEQQ